MRSSDLLHSSDEQFFHPYDGGCSKLQKKYANLAFLFLSFFFFCQTLGKELQLLQASVEEYLLIESLDEKPSKQNECFSYARNTHSPGIKWEASPPPDIK